MGRESKTLRNVSSTTMGGFSMDDIIFERDYHEEHEQQNKNNPAFQIYDRAVNGTFFKDFNDAMDTIPKIIVPEDKANYEYLLNRCDELAHRLGGKVRGIVDFHHWSANIDVTLPFFEFGSPDELEFMKEISEKADYVLFEPEKDGKMRMHIMVNYFEDLMTEEHKGYLRYDAIMNDPVLASMLQMPELPPDVLEIAQRMKATLDRFEAETDADRTTVFKAVLENMMKQDEENQTLEFMADRMDQLLEMYLNGESEE